MKIKELLITVKWFPSHIFNKIMLRVRGFSYGKRFITYGKIFIRGHGKISIGNDVVITSCRETNPIGGDVKCILYTKNQGEIVIGNNVGISNAAIVATDSIIIEDNVRFMIMIFILLTMI